MSSDKASRYWLKDFRMEDLDGKAERLADEPARLAFWYRTESFLADNQDRFQAADGESWDPTSGIAPSVGFLLSEIRQRIERIESLPQTPIGRAYHYVAQQILDAANRVSPLKDQSPKPDLIAPYIIKSHKGCPLRDGSWRRLGRYVALALQRVPTNKAEFTLLTPFLDELEMVIDEYDEAGEYVRNAGLGVDNLYSTSRGTASALRAMGREILDAEGY